MGAELARAGPGNPPSARALPRHGGRRARHLRPGVPGGSRNGPARPVPPRSLRRGLGGPKAAATPGGAGRRRGSPRRLPAALGVPCGLTPAARFAVLACAQFREPCWSWRQALCLYYYYRFSLDAVFKCTLEVARMQGAFLRPPSPSLS